MLPTFPQTLLLLLRFFSLFFFLLTTALIGSHPGCNHNALFNALNNDLSSYSPTSSAKKASQPEQQYIEEPQFVEPGDEFGDQPVVGKQPKYAEPDTDLAKKALAVCGRKGFKKGEKMAWKKIEKGMMPLASGLTSDYPTEWVLDRIKVFSEMNQGGIAVKANFPKLLSAINNAEKKADWVANWRSEHKNIAVSDEEAKALGVTDDMTEQERNAVLGFGMPTPYTAEEEENEAFIQSVLGMK